MNGLISITGGDLNKMFTPKAPDILKEGFCKRSVPLKKLFFPKERLYPDLDYETGWYKLVHIRTRKVRCKSKLTKRELFALSLDNKRRGEDFPYEWVEIKAPQGDNNV